MRPSVFPFAAIGLLVTLAGCQTGDVAQRIPISGGGEITVQLSREGLKPGEADGYQVNASVLVPGKEAKEAAYTFGLVAHREPALRRIQIDDISDETAVTLVDDTDPKFKDHVWRTITAPITAEDPRMKWVYQITGSMRVYHFTLTRTDGTQVAFNHVMMYPPGMKMLMRNAWGEKY